MYETGDLEQAEAVLAEASEAAEAARLSALQARIRVLLAEIRALQGGPEEEALAECEAATAILEAEGDLEGLAEAWQLTGTIQFWLGHSPGDCPRERRWRSRLHRRRAGELLEDTLERTGARCGARRSLSRRRTQSEREARPADAAKLAGKVQLRALRHA